MKLFKKAKKGFTLVELVVVIAVIAILAAVSVGAYFGVTDSANRSKLEQEAKQAYTNIQLVSLVDSKDGFDLDIDGLSIDELDDFQREVAKAGGDYVFTDSYDAIDDEKPTIVLNTQAVSASNTQSVYKQFDYYIPTISGMHANCNILNGGKITIVKGDNPAFGDINNTETPDTPNPDTPDQPEEPDHEHSFNNNGPTCDDPNCNEPNPNYVAPNPVTGVSITNKPSSALVLNTTNKNSYQLYAEAVVSDSSKESTDTFNIEWSADNSGHVTVNESGFVTAVSEGETVVTATIKVGDVIKGTDTAIIKVEKPEVLVDITTTKTNYYIGEDNDVTFTVSVTSEDTLSDYGVIWSTNNDEITISNEGKIVFGSTVFSDLVVTATSKIDPNAQDTITISLDKKLTNIEISEENKNVELNVGEPVDLSTFINTNGANIGTDLTYVSNNTAVTVEGSVITANTYVTDAITVIVSNEYDENSFNITIKNPINSLVIKHGTNVINSLTLTLGDSELGTKDVVASLTKNYGNESPTISWSASSNAATTPISITNPTSTNATITAEAVGTATLSVTASLNGSVATASIPVEVVDYDTLTIEQANQITKDNQREEIYYLSGYILNWEEYNPSNKYTGNRSYILVDDLSNPTTANKLKVWESSVNGTFDNSYNYQPNETTHFESLGYNIGDKLTLKCVIANTNSNGIYAEGNILTDRSVKTNLTVKATCVNGGDIPLTTTDNVVYSYTDLDVHGGDEISISYSYTDGSPVNKVVDIAASDDTTTNYIASADGKLSFTFDFSTQEFTPTFVPSETGGTETPEVQEGWVLVTDASTLKENDKIIIAAASEDYALGAQASNNRTGEAVVKEENTISDIGGAEVITLEEGNKTGTFAFKTSEGYLYAASSSANQLKTQSTKTENGAWTIEITNGNTSIQAKDSSNRNVLRYNPNNGNPIFSCYEDGKQNAVCLYRNNNYKPTPITLKSISVTPTSIELSVDDFVTIQVTGTGTNNKEFDISGKVSFVSNQPSIATVTSAGEVKGISVGDTTIVVSVAREGEEPLTAIINVKINEKSESTEITREQSSFSEISGNVENDTNISYEAQKGTAGTAPAVNDNQIRIYQNGGLLIVRANNGKTLSSVTIGTAMKTTIKYKIGNAEEFGSGKSLSVGGKLPVNNINSSIITFQCAGTDKNSRLYLNYLSVTYK